MTRKFLTHYWLCSLVCITSFTHASMRQHKKDPIRISLPHKTISGLEEILKTTPPDMVTLQIPWIRVNWCSWKPDIRALVRTIAFFAKNNIKTNINVELTEKGVAPTAAKVTKECLIKYGLPDQRLLVSSTFPEELRKFRAAMPSVRIGLIVPYSWTYNYIDCLAHRAIPWEIYKKLDVNVLCIPPELATERVVKLAHTRKSNKLYVHSVSDSQTIKRLKLMGIDGVFS